MLLLWFVLWVIAALLYFTDRKNEKIRWGSFLTFLSGCGGLAVVVHEDVHDYFQNLQASPGIFKMLDFIYALFSSLAYFMAPYALLIFSLVDHGIARRTFFKIVLLLPVVIMYVLFPLYPKYLPDYSILSIWVVPYVLIANIILIYSSWKEKNFILKRQKMLTISLVLPTTLFAVTTNYVLQSLDISGAWRYNTWIISLEFIGFLYFSLRYGFLGVRLRLEKQRFDLAVKTASSGTAILNHTIKNELGKINILANELIQSEFPEVPEIYRRKIDLIQQSSLHVLEMAKRIHHRINVMELKESVFRLIDTIENSLNLLYSELKSFKIEKHYTADLMISGDSVQLRDTLINCIKNSIEAMDRERGGKLSLKVYQERHQVFIEITDNGKGIEPGNIPYILDPFYSTKITAGNYGLGLTYCYGVMQKHGGNLTLKSKINQGTTVTLSLPAKRIQNSTREEVS